MPSRFYAGPFGPSQAIRTGRFANAELLLVERPDPLHDARTPPVMENASRPARAVRRPNARRRSRGR